MAHFNVIYGSVLTREDHPEEVKPNMLVKLLIQYSRKLCSNKSKFNVDNGLRRLYSQKGLRELDFLVPYLLPSSHLFAAVTYLYLGLLTQEKNINEVVLLPRKGLCLDQPILSLGYQPLLLEIHQNNKLGDDKNLGAQLEFIQNVGPENEYVNPLRNKNVLIVDNDYMEGGTLSKAHRCISKFNPATITLFTLMGGLPFFDYVSDGSCNHYELFSRNTLYQLSNLDNEDEILKAFVINSLFGSKRSVKLPEKELISRLEELCN